MTRRINFSVQRHEKHNYMQCIAPRCLVKVGKTVKEGALYVIDGYFELRGTKLPRDWNSSKYFDPRFYDLTAKHLRVTWAHCELRDYTFKEPVVEPQFYEGLKENAPFALSYFQVRS